jgi:broad specificity phosphatase PhoE
MRAYFIRHCQAAWQIDRTAGLNSALSDLGRKQARCAARWAAASFPLSDDRTGSVPEIWTSPLLRAAATAEAIAAELRQVAVPKSKLAEADFHLGSVLPTTECPFGLPAETADDACYAGFKAQVSEILAETFERSRGSRPLICVTHAGVIETALRVITGFDGIRFSIDNGSVTTIEWRDGHWHLHELNECSHVPDALRSS